MGPTARVAVRAATWPLLPVCLAASYIASAAMPDEAGAVVGVGDLPYLVAMLACWAVGVVLTGRAFSQPAGWAFLGLGTALAANGFFDNYAELALRWQTDLPGGAMVASLSDTTYVWWFVALALILQFTPPARPAGRLGRLLPTVTVLSGLVYYVAALLRTDPRDPPFDDVVSPLAIDALDSITSAVATVAVIVVGLCVIASVVTLVAGWRRSEGEARQQLLWLVAGAAPLAPCVLGAFVASYADRAEIAGLLMSGAIVALAAGAGLSVLRYRLYDVERVVADSAAYAIAAAAVVMIFVVVLVAISQTTPIDASSQVPTVVATLAAAGTARIAYLWGRRAVERRLNRGRFDAVEMLRAGLEAAAPDLDSLLADALGDPTARVVYPAEGGAWVTADGREVAPHTGSVDVRRHNGVTARIEFDPDRCDLDMVEAVAKTAGPEIDNLALRAELARQVELISESRSRLANAHLEERTRIERDLHDGAQQRLLAIALQLQSAQVNGAEPLLRDQVDHAVAELGATVQELRDLAGGLQPAALAGGGLLAAVADLVSRTPLRISCDVVEARFPPSVEAAAWFVVAEAVANVVKHADARDVSITVATMGAGVSVLVADDGVGRADPRGRGLQGLADRVAAAGGRLRVAEKHPHGTVVEAQLPCGS